jgi:tetratricopeptide (TPR) repeat protein
MKASRLFLNRIVAALVLFLLVLPAARAESARLDELFAMLSQPDLKNWQRVEEDIWREWSKSGSPAMDLLLERGRQALAEGDSVAAIDHLTALIDHAPDFAEGWNARATAYYQAGLYGPSLADIGQVLTLNPRHFGALAGLGMILEELGQDQRALAVYRRTLAIHPHQATILESVERLEAKAAGQEL